MKFTQRSFSLYRLGLSTVSKLVRFFFRVGVDAMCTPIQQMLSGLVVSVVYWVVGSNTTDLRINFSFSPSDWRNLHFSEHFRLEISSKRDIKAQTVLPCINFMRGERGYGLWDLMLTPLLFSLPIVPCTLPCLPLTQRDLCRGGRGKCIGYQGITLH